MSLKELLADPRTILFCRIMLGGVFVMAALGKLPRRYEFLRTLRDQFGVPHGAVLKPD